MSEAKEKQRQLSKLKDKIKKDLSTHPIENGRISYSVVEKKGKMGITSNDRVLFLIHGKQIGYSKQFDKNTKIPFEKLEDLPAFKDRFLITQYKNMSVKGKEMVISFDKNKNVEKWEMACASPDLARNWERTIQLNIQFLKQEAKNTAEKIVINPTTINNQLQPKVEQEKPQQPKQMIKMEEGEPEIKQQKKQYVNNPVQPPSHNNESYPPKIPQQNMENPNIQPPSQKPNPNIQPPSQQPNPNIQPPNNNSPSKPEQSQLFNFLKQQPTIKQSKPQSSLFVGSVSVDSAQDQQKLKQRIEIFSKMNLKMKGQYQQKREQQKLMKKQIKNQDNPLANIFAFSTNIKLQIEKMRQEWGYQFAKGQNEYDIVESFKIYSELVTRKIIDELGLTEKKRYYQPIQETSTSIKYEINGVIFEIFLTELKEITAFQDKGTIVSKQESKMALTEFKNLNYVLSLTHNKGKIRVPLSTIVEYKGFVIFAKVITPAAEAYDNMDVLQRQLEILEAESRINTSVFQDPECSKIVALQSKAYEKLARAENLPNKKFDFCYIDSLNHYLPNDFNNFSKEKPFEKLRAELIQDDQCQQIILYGEDMCTLSSRLKLPQNYRNGMQELENVSKLIYERIQIFLDKLQNLEITFCNSKELSRLMHDYGINMRYLGYLLEKANVNWIKEIIMSEICARCGKNFLNFDMQDCLLNLSETNYEAVSNFQAKQVVNFLNKMLGKGQQTEVFWKQMNRQAQSYYRVSINQQQINQGFLLQALQIHCNFRLKNIDESVNIFNSITPFGVHHMASFEIKSKVYDMEFTQLYKSVKNLINQPSDESYEQLKIILNLHRIQNIPSHFRMSDIYDDILKFLVNWLPPVKARDLYYPQEIQFGEILPSATLYEIKLAEIRWGLKNNQIEESQTVKQWMIDHINKWIGEAHPILTELYELFANYHLLFKDQEKKAVNYSKSAIRNQEKLVGGNNQKMADCYYLLGTIYLSYGKKVEAVNSLKKAYDIILKSENQESEACGEVCLKLGQLYLTLNSLQQAIDLGLKSMDILSQYGTKNSQIRAIQLVCRCYELSQDWQPYMKLIDGHLINQVQVFIDEVELAQRIIKVIILPSFKIIGSNNSIISQKILKILQELPETTRAPNMAYNFLRTRIEEKIYPQKFLEVLADIQEIIDEIENNGMLTRWKGFQNLSNKSLLNKVGINMQNKGFYFIASLEATSIFINQSYIIGLLTDNI